MTHVLLTVRFFDNRYHGLLDRGGPVEWPPSPFRLFQALVAGVARRGKLVVGVDKPENTNFTAIGKALGWLQNHTREHPPIIIAPRHKVGQAITRFVPNNDGDMKFDRQQRLTAKPTIPTLFLLEEGQKPEVHYVWDISNASDAPVDRIRDAARSLTTLGWGIDMAFADAYLADEAKLQSLKGIRWYPKNGLAPFKDSLRTPTYDAELGKCTLCDLRHCHSTLLNRVEHGRPLKTVDKPTVFDRVLYTSVERGVGRPAIVFRIECDDEARRFTYSQSKLIHVAGMVRCLAIRSMASKQLLERLYPNHDQSIDPFRDGNPPCGIAEPDLWIERYVAGHRNRSNSPDTPHTQFSYIPLQSIGHDHTDPGVRRVMIVAPIGDDAWLNHLARQLDGQLLKPLPNTTLPPGTRLELIDERKKDGVRDAYLRKSRSWASVTPVILPGHDDHKSEKTRKLIEKALMQSGIEQPCEFEWSAFSHFRKMLGAHKYVKDDQAPDRKRRINYILPDHLFKHTAVHLKLTFRTEVPGPITVGSGRHCGLGLLAGIDP